LLSGFHWQFENLAFSLMLHSNLKVCEKRKVE
jgi:hypothetical protein